MDEKETNRWLELINLINQLPIDKQKPFADMIEEFIRKEAWEV